MTPVERARIHRQLSAVWNDSYQALLARLQAVIDDPVRWREQNRLRELLQAHEAYMGRITDYSHAWWEQQVPALMNAGATDFAALYRGRIAFAQIDLNAVQDFATRSWEDVAARLQNIDERTRWVIRSWTRDAGRQALMESRTALQAGRNLANVAARNGLWSVTYVNGAEVPMNHYSNMLARTVTAQSYNQGSLVQARADGIEYIQYHDGPDCGVESHDDPVKADGLVVPVGDVVVLAHPNCRRALSPAPFYVSQPEAPVLDAGETGGRVRASMRREPRGVRQPREPRAVRKQRSDI